MLKVALLATDNRENDHNYSPPIPYFGAAPSALLEGFAVCPEIEVHVMSCTQKPLSSPQKLNHNIWFHSLHVPKIGWLRSGYAGCVLAVRRKLREIRPSLVHGQGTERDCGISAAFSGFPNVITIHGNMAELARMFHAPWGSFRSLASWLENFTLPRTGGVLCNSLYTQSLVAPRAKKTWLVPNPIRSSFFAPISRSSHPNQVPVFLVIGVISQRKRQLEIFRQLRQFFSQNIRFHVRFIGECGHDPYGRSFRQALQEVESLGWASAPGVMSEADLVREMDAADALIHFPSEESFGLVVAESLARGLQLFASNVGGIPDIAAAIPGAQLFHPEDWRGLQKALQEWLSRGVPSPASPANPMESRYHPRVIARQHLEIYRDVLADAGHYNPK